MTTREIGVTVDARTHHQTELGPVIVADAKGRVTIAEAESFSAQVASIVEQAPAALVLDASGLTFLSSAGIGELIKLEHTLRAKKSKFFLANVSPEVNTVLEHSKIDEMIPMYASIEQALRHTDIS